MNLYLYAYVYFTNNRETRKKKDEKDNLWWWYYTAGDEKPPPKLKPFHEAEILHNPLIIAYIHNILYLVRTCKLAGISGWKNAPFYGGLFTEAFRKMLYEILLNFSKQPTYRNMCCTLSTYFYN